MSKKKAFIRELIEYGQWYPYHKYYDLYKVGPKDTPRHKKRMKMADWVRQWKNKEEKTTGVRPEVEARKN